LASYHFIINSTAIYGGGKCKYKTFLGLYSFNKHLIIKGLKPKKRVLIYFAHVQKRQCEKSVKTVAQAGVPTGLLLVYNELTVGTPATAIVFTQPQKYVATYKKVLG